MPLFSEKDADNPKVDDASDEADALAKGFATVGGAVDKLDVEKGKKAMNVLKKKQGHFEDQMDGKIGFDRSVDRRKAVCLLSLSFRALEHPLQLKHTHTHTHR